MGSVQRRVYVVGVGMTKVCPGGSRVGLVGQGCGDVTRGGTGTKIVCRG